MRVISLICLLTCFSLNTFANPLIGLTLVNGCKLFDVSGFNFKNLPGAMCLFLDDGSFISANENAIRLITKTNEVKWEMKGHFHHQINFSSDKKRILALSSDISNETNKKYRQDKLLILNLQGKILHQRLMIDIYKDSKTDPISLNLDPHLRPLFGDGHEISHLNSIYEIPSNAATASYMKEGNIVINGLMSGIQILTPDLSHVVYHTKLKTAVHHAVHDVQINSKGNFLLFVNAVANKKNRNVSHPNWRSFNDLHSAIQEINPATNDIVSEFETTPAEIFYSKACGSIQEINNDIWLFTHIISGTYIYSKKEKKILHSIPATHLNDHQFIPVQQVKALDLSQFLSHWK